MATFTYAAKRNVMDGHTLGEEYELEIPVSDWTPNSEPVTSEVVSLGGTVYTTLHRIDKMISVASVEENDPTFLRQLDEFLDSVAAGEPFDVVDPFQGAYTCQIDGKPRRSLVHSTGYYRCSFNLRKA